MKPNLHLQCCRLPLANSVQNSAPALMPKPPPLASQSSKGRTHCLRCIKLDQMHVVEQHLERKQEVFVSVCGS